MKVFELGDNMTTLSHKGFAQEDIKIKVGDRLLDIVDVHDENGTMIVTADESLEGLI